MNRALRKVERAGERSRAARREFELAIFEAVDSKAGTYAEVSEAAGFKGTGSVQNIEAKERRRRTEAGETG